MHTRPPFPPSNPPTFMYPSTPFAVPVHAYSHTGVRRLFIEIFDALLGVFSTPSPLPRNPSSREGVCYLKYFTECVAYISKSDACISFFFCFFFYRYRVDLDSDIDTQNSLIICVCIPPLQYVACQSAAYRFAKRYDCMDLPDAEDPNSDLRANGGDSAAGSSNGSDGYRGGGGGGGNLSRDMVATLGEVRPSFRDFEAKSESRVNEKEREGA